MQGNLGCSGVRNSQGIFPRWSLLEELGGISGLFYLEVKRRWFFNFFYLLEGLKNGHFSVIGRFPWNSFMEFSWIFFFVGFFVELCGFFFFFWWNFPRIFLNSFREFSQNFHRIFLQFSPAFSYSFFHRIFIEFNGIFHRIFNRIFIKLSSSP